MSEERIDIRTADGAMPAYVASPEGGSKGAVVVIQEAFGVNEHIEDVCRRLAAVGWTGLAPALFHRQGSPVFSYDDLGPVLPAMQQLTAEGLGMDIDAAVAELGRRGFAPPRCGITGFCMGGSVTFVAAARHALGAAVTFYGGGVAQGRFGMPSQIEVAPTLQTPWLGLYGDLDQGVPVADVEQLRLAAAKAAVPTEIVRYPDAQHGFHCNERPAVFHAEAAADGWQRALAWFDRFIPQP